MEFDLTQTDQLLSTTRAVRKRLDFTKPVPRELINQCLELAVQAPTGSNSQTWRWLVIEDAEQRQALADLYRKGAGEYLTAAGEQANETGDAQTQRVFSSAIYLAEHLQEAPVHIIPCVQGRPPEPVALTMASGLYGSIYPAIWSFQLAARARGLGTALTTLHLIHEKEAAEILGLPDDVLQVALLPLAYTKGTDFKAASRPPVADITHWDRW
ncbi:MAG: nitroreductase [Limisphaerales bacterium]|jgi:nitroreductase